MTGGQPARPANCEQIVAINQGRLPLTMSEPVAEPHTPSESAGRLKAEPNLCVLDGREPSAFGAGHIPRAVNIPVSSPKFEQRVGWVFDPETSFLLLAENDEDLGRALHKMAFLGLDRRARGYVSGGMAAWIRAGLPHETLHQITVHELHEELRREAGNGCRVVDVRESEEWTAGHIEGALHLNYKTMGKDSADFPFPRDETIALICAGGIRSATAASLLLRQGFRRILNVVGGMTAWRAAGYDVVRERQRRPDLEQH